ncbi:uncharacterized protein LOC135385733 [Ornithodoros turicata]|uniref:uncharacterized protein LOC135385733 n=1 Tax=Ornithodoros turicata TaxID=34597 RepID=UPI003139C65C
MNGWVVTGVNKAHNNIGIVYRDSTQADFELSEVHNSSRRSSGASTQFDTGESFFLDETRKTRRDVDDVFLFDNSALKSVPDTRAHTGPSFDKTLLLLDQSVPTSHVRTTNPQDLSPTTALEMWERNETFQDLTQLIAEERTSSSSTPCYLTDTVAESGSTGNMSTSPTWVPGHPTKRPYDPSMAGPSSSGLPAKMCCVDDAVPSPPRVEQYSKMRVRNNEASKRSRMTRKEKEQEMEKKCQELEQDNQMLRIKAKNLEELIDTLKKQLITAIVKK